jgi:hypothetical protein
MVVEYDKDKDYYSEFWKVFVLNEVMVLQLRDLSYEVNALKDGIRKI